MREKTKKTLQKHLLIFLTVAIYFIVLHFLGMGCPIRHFTGVPCPTCGMTRSTLALIRGNVSLSLYYHPLTIPTLLIVWTTCHAFLFPKYKKWITGILVLYIPLFTGVYLYRLFYGLIP